MGAVAAELQSIGHRPNFFYLQHAMGLASSMGLGIALSRPELTVVVFDGDGSVLMNLGGLTTLARYRPKNLVHVVFDNESLLSVGGFPTATSTGSDIAGIAAAAGVPRTSTVRDLDEFVAAFDDALAGERADDDRREGRGGRTVGVRHRPVAVGESISVCAVLERAPMMSSSRANARDLLYRDRAADRSQDTTMIPRRFASRDRHVLPSVRAHVAPHPTRRRAQRGLAQGRRPHAAARPDTPVIGLPPLFARRRA